mmetsp:Transcript_9079/g.30035  ORF Transcript_9079/g.30035 Transcript_9079/m.30035 type:complete len:379 (-) Transcript_9079:135-1271(-)
MVEARRVRLDSLEVEEPRRPASPPHPRRERLEPREKRPTPRVLLVRARADAGVHVQRAALRQQHRHRHRPSRLGAGDEAEVDPVGHARQRGGRLHVVARMHRAPPLDAVRRDVAREGGESILVPLASVHVRRAGMDEVREGEVADAGVQVNHLPRGRLARRTRRKKITLGAAGATVSPAHGKLPTRAFSVPLPELNIERHTSSPYRTPFSLKLTQPPAPGGHTRRAPLLRCSASSTCPILPCTPSLAAPASAASAARRDSLAAGASAARASAAPDPGSNIPLGAKRATSPSFSHFEGSDCTGKRRAASARGSPDDSRAATQRPCMRCRLSLVRLSVVGGGRKANDSSPCCTAYASPAAVSGSATAPLSARKARRPVSK